MTELYKRRIKEIAKGLIVLPNPMVMGEIFTKTVIP